jgi:DNA-binding NtrC family response regulator
MGRKIRLFTSGQPNFSAMGPRNAATKPPLNPCSTVERRRGSVTIANVTPSIPAPHGPSLLFAESDRETCRAVVARAVENPFARAAPEGPRVALGVLRKILEAARAALARGAAASDDDLLLYQEACIYFLYKQHEGRLLRRVHEGMSDREEAAHFAAFGREHQRFLHVAGERIAPLGARHLFARFFELARAKDLIRSEIVGTSAAADQLRVDVWESIAGDDLRLHLNGRPDRMKDVHTLVLGPTGSGKDVVARILGQSCFIPVDEDTGCFVCSYKDRYRPLNLAAKSQSLIEAELLGYVRGAFTGADKDRRGDLDMGPDGGVIFLDELAEIPLATQVLLLRVLEAHELQPVGSRVLLPFTSRIVAATHEDLDALLAQKRLREDFLHRIKANVVRTPPLALMLSQAPGDLALYVRFFADKACAPASGEALADKTMRYLERRKLLHYGWGGNLRELQKCVLGVMARGKGPIDADLRAPGAPKADAVAAKSEAPPSSRAGGGEAAVYRAIFADRPTLYDIVERVVSWKFAECHNLREVARELNINRSTVAARLHPDVVAEFEEILARRKR